MSKGFSSRKDLTYAVSTKEDGNQSFEWGEKKEVLGNRMQFLEMNGLNIKDGATIRLEHKDKIMIIDDNYKNEGMFDLESAFRADALLTDKDSVFLYMLTADCLPISLYDLEKKVVGIIHLSWLCTDKLFIKTVLKKMIEKFGSNPKDILVNIGPGIRKDSYLFDSPKKKNLKNWSKYIELQENGKTAIDLVAYNIDQLTEMGILVKNIFDEDIDTNKDNRFFSHYRTVCTGEKEGRFATVLGLR